MCVYRTSLLENGFQIKSSLISIALCRLGSNIWPPLYCITDSNAYPNQLLDSVRHQQATYHEFRKAMNIFSARVRSSRPTCKRAHICLILIRWEMQTTICKHSSLSHAHRDKFSVDEPEFNPCVCMRHDTVACPHMNARRFSYTCKQIQPNIALALSTLFPRTPSIFIIMR